MNAREAIDKASFPTVVWGFDNSLVDRPPDHTEFDHRAAETCIVTPSRCRELEPRILRGSDEAFEVGGEDIFHDEIPGYLSP